MYSRQRVRNLSNVIELAHSSLQSSCVESNRSISLYCSSSSALSKMQDLETFGISFLYRSNILNSTSFKSTHLIPKCIRIPSIASIKCSLSSQLSNRCKSYKFFIIRSRFNVSIRLNYGRLPGPVIMFREEWRVFPPFLNNAPLV